MSLALLFLALRFVLAVQFGFIGAVVLIPPAMFFLYGFVKYWRLKISRVLFFEEHFEVFGRGTRENLRYEEIQMVELLQATSFWAPSLHVTIHLKQKDNPLLLIMNPRSKSLGIDLYTWLVGKLSTKW
jgi:hypothetical protein